MFSLLTYNNLDLKKEIETTLDLLSRVEICAELNLCHQWICNTLTFYQERIDYNLSLINMEEKELLPEIVSETQSLTSGVRQISENFLAPLIRHKPIDTFCLKVINWLHKEHRQTQSAPFALSDGGFAVFSDLNGPIVYFLPTTSLSNITHVPLIFHEFGHYLYAYHKEEMDDLVSELQTKIWNLLKPSYRTNNSRYLTLMEKISAIAETWYEWMQEFFCDAVGLHIGGKSYLKTFSMYLRMMGTGEFKAFEDELLGSTHPVSWLRVRLLSIRAKKYGLIAEAEQTEREWKLIANELNVKQDYFGFYDEAFDNLIHQALDDMLTEAGPLYFSDYLNKEENSNLIMLVNKAWDLMETNFEEYKGWENSAIALFMNSSEQHVEHN